MESSQIRCHTARHWHQLAVVTVLVCLVLAGGFAPGCRSTPPTPVTARADPFPIGHLENTFRLTPDLYSGSGPETADDFAALAAAGVRSIVSVDGALPPVALAEAAGLRYVHVPIAYGGITREQETRIASAFRELPKPVYFHCHHGMHRGPAAAMIALQAAGCTDAAGAEAMMGILGTSRSYAGLYRDVMAFQPMTQADWVPLARLPARAPVADFPAGMSALDHCWERIGLLADGGWKTLPDHPDIDPPHEALMLREHFAELLRLAEREKRPADFMTWMHNADSNAGDRETGLRQGRDATWLNARRKLIGQSCGTCHKAYRN